MITRILLGLPGLRRARTKIAELRRPEEGVREAEQRYRRLMEHVDDAVLVHDLAGRLTDVNEAACESLGYTRERLLGLGMADVDETFGPERIAQLRHLVESGETTTIEAVHRRSDGSTFPIEARVGPIRVEGDPRILAIAHNLTRRRNVQRALDESEERFRLMVEESEQVFFFAHGPDHRFTYLSPSVESVLGHRPEELIGQPFEVLHPGDPTDAEVQELTELALATGTSQRAYTAVNRHKDGRTVPLEIIESPIIRDGETVGLHGFARDISDRVRSERALRKSEAQLRHAQKMEAVGRLAGGVAHDFNNILTAIKGHAHFLLGDLPPDDPHRGDAEEIRRAADRAAVLTRDLLAFSRRQVLQPRVLDVNEIVLGTAKMVRRMIGEDVTLRTELEPDAGRIKADRGQMEQVLVNLVVNARDAMPGGGELVIRSDRVEFEPGGVPPRLNLEPGPFARVSVIDTGVGMTREVRERIFEPFFTTKHKGEGTGLGLSTVYGIIKQSGGDVGVESAVGEGTAFELFLPVTDEETPSSAPPAAPPPADEPAGGETILVVEDEDAVRRMVRRTLERPGYRVLEAADGAEALEIARRHPGELDLVITDVIMPGLGGREVARRLAEERPSIMILYMSGYTEDDVLERGVMRAGERFLAKPFSPATLLETVGELLGLPTC